MHEKYRLLVLDGHGLDSYGSHLTPEFDNISFPSACHFIHHLSDYYQPLDMSPPSPRPKGSRHMGTCFKIERDWASTIWIKVQYKQNQDSRFIPDPNKRKTMPFFPGHVSNKHQVHHPHQSKMKFHSHFRPCQHPRFW